MSSELVYIEWDDSATQHGWIDPERVHNTPSHIQSIGWVVKEDDDVLVIAGHRQIDDGTDVLHVSDPLIIPQRVITTRQTLRTDFHDAPRVQESDDERTFVDPVIDSETMRTLLRPMRTLGELMGVSEESARLWLAAKLALYFAEGDAASRDRIDDAFGPHPTDDLPRPPRRSMWDSPVTEDGSRTPLSLMQEWEMRAEQTQNRGETSIDQALDTYRGILLGRIKHGKSDQ